MFIKLTRFDNRPIWLNAGFIVTVEPRKDGVGSVVVPAGDGFDYDVRESAAEILAKLGEAPASSGVSPEPVSPCAERSVGASSEKRLEEAPAAVEGPAAGEKRPKKRVTRKPKAEKTAEKGAECPVGENPPAPLELSPDQIVRLARLAPKSVSKLKNTLSTQFHLADVGATVQALAAKGILSLAGSRVLWPVPAGDQAEGGADVI